MKAFFVVSFVLLSCGLLFGQGFSVGANIGGGYHTLNPDLPDSDIMTGIGFGGGAVFELDFLPTIGVEVDVQYAVYKYSFSETGFEMKADISNLVIPVLFKYKMPMPTISPYFAVGPSLIKNLSGTITMVDDGLETSWDIDSEDLETDFGLQIGAGANLGMIPSIGISPYARFQYNLTADMDDTDSAKESMHDILFGINFIYKIK
jgi:hypothetical protein